MIQSLRDLKLMKSLPFYVLAFGISFFIQFHVHAQSAVQEKVERYLYTCYDAGKSGLKENERILNILETRLNDFVFAMDKARAAEMKGHEKEFNEFLNRVDKLKDVKIMQQMVEDSKRSYKIVVANILERGVQSVDEAQECRKAIVFKMMEIDLLKMRQDKLVNLLKDENSRGKFIHALLSGGGITEQTDLRHLMAAVDKSIAELGI